MIRMFTENVGNTRAEGQMVCVELWPPGLLPVQKSTTVAAQPIGNMSDRECFPANTAGSIAV